LDGSNGGAGVALAGPRLDGGESVGVGHAGGDQLGLEPLDRVDRPPGASSSLVRYSLRGSDREWP
jgi:hypothetical protein